MMHLHHQEITTFMKNDLKSAVQTEKELITLDKRTKEICLCRRFAGFPALPQST